MFKVLLFISTVFATPLLAKSVDPTKPLNHTQSNAAGSKTKQDIELQSIIKDGGQLKVIVNGNLLKVGDKFQQYRLTLVTEQYIVLLSEEQELKIPLFSKVVEGAK